MGGLTIREFSVAGFDEASAAPGATSGHEYIDFKFYTILGMLGYFHKFMRGFTDIAKPIRNIVAAA